MESKQQFNRLHATWSPNSETCPEQKAAERTALMFGCYRKGDANDPETYCAAVAAVLSRYSQDVVEYVTDPRTGLPGSCKWLPSVAEVKEACTARRDYLNRAEDFKRRFAGRTPVKALPLDEDRPGRRAGIRVHQDAPQYPALREWIKTADDADWKFDGDGQLWVSHTAPALADCMRWRR
jgi:hypothetical protein